MSFAEVKEYLEIFSRKAFHCFVNVIVEDSVIIYYEEFQNPVDKKIYEPLQKLPYRNYMKGPLLEKGAPVYLVLVDIKERIEALYADLEEADYTSKNKI